MKQIRCFFYLLVMALAATGCAAVSGPARTNEQPQANPGASAEEDLQESPYYHYTRSELHKRQGEYDKALASLLKAVTKDPDSSFLKKELIALYLHTKETSKALEVAQSLVELEPENTDALMILGKMRQVLHQDSEARDIYQKILQLNPDQENIYLILGRMHMDSGNTDEAFRIYTKMTERFPESYASHFFLGRIHAIKNNPEYAEKEFLKTLEINPPLVEPRFELITIYQNQATPRTAPKIVRLYKEILEIDSNNIRAALELPLFYHNHGKKDEADALLAEMGKKSLENRGITIITAREFIGSKRYKDASVVFTGMLKGAPGDSTLNYLAGISFDSLKQTKNAIKHFLKVAPDSEHYKKTIVHIAFSYSENDQKDKAIEFLEAKHRELPEDIDIIMYLASFYEEGLHYEKAITLLNKGIALSDSNTALIFRLGIVQDKSGQKEACIESMKKVIELEPSNANALNYLGYTYAEMGENLATAEELVSRALAIKPEDGFITDSLGWIYYKKGLISEAVAILEKAADLTQFDPVITEHLGDAYREDNRLEKALEAYKKARSKTTGSNPGLDTKIKHLEQQLNELN
ncbi:MAG: tetratricopeptide repeat protein [Desulfobacteraceae bacterium]|nr:tetratricopeptide repeat protein [Desulfobacteraceae bacterium]